MGIWTIYQHKFPNGKSYIGKTSQFPEARWGKDGEQYKLQPLMWNAINKYGWNNVEHIILEEGLTAEEADKKEYEYINKFHTYYLDELGPGYNMTYGGEGAAIINPCKVEETYKQKQNTYWVAEQLGIDRGSVARILKKLGYDLTKNSCKMISQFTLDGKYIASYESAREASKKVGIDYRLISGVVRGIAKSSGGFQWRYYNDEDIFGISPIKRNKGGHSPKRVAQYDINNNLIKVYESVADAAKTMNRSRANIRLAAQGKNHTAAGYKWKFMDEDDVN